MRVQGLLTSLVAVGLVACNDPFSILPATRENRVDTVALFAVNGTPLELPGAYLLSTKTRYRLGIDLLPYNFDFVYRIHATSGPQLVPFNAIAPPTPGSTTGTQAGFQATTSTFDAIAEALQTGYITTEPVDLAVGRVFYVRSGLPNGCFLLIPYYAKLEVLSFDPVERSVKFRILVNNNCGYRGLEPGLPER